MSSDPDATDNPGSWEWAACGASVTGWQHVARGVGCDDAYGYGITGDYVVAAVADGAGSVSGTSAWGSYVACQSILVDAMDSEFIRDFQSGSAERTQSLMRWLFDGALGRLVNYAELLDLPIARLSTTLCVAVADRDRAVFGQIGDGVIAAERSGSIETVLIEAKDEYANATWFVQSNGAFEESFRTSVLTEVSAFALSTDGMSYKITNIATGEAYEPFFKGSWGHVRLGAPAADFAALLRGIEDDQTGDDKTMVLAALRWEQDRFHPSARPVSKTIVNSPPPQPETMSAGPREPESAEEPTDEQRNGSVPEQTPEQSVVDAIATVDPEVKADDAPLDPAGENKRRWFGGPRHN